MTGKTRLRNALMGALNPTHSSTPPNNAQSVPGQTRPGRMGCVWKVRPSGQAALWILRGGFSPYAMSIRGGRLLVTPVDGKQLPIYDPQQKLVRRITLPRGIKPRHAIETGHRTVIDTVHHDTNSSSSSSNSRGGVGVGVGVVVVVVVVGGGGGGAGGGGGGGGVGGGASGSGSCSGSGSVSSTNSSSSSSSNTEVLRYPLVLGGRVNWRTSGQSKILLQ